MNALHRSRRALVGLGVVAALGLLACEKKDSPAEPSPPKPEPVASTPSPTPATDDSPVAAAASPAASAIPAPPDVSAAPTDAQKTPSGLASKVIAKGAGKDHPGPSDKVKVHYTGWTKSGQMFDSSVVRGEPIDFGLSEVIPGWTEGVQLMVKGEKRRLWIPAKLAYGDHPRGGAPAGDLVFDIELVDMSRAAPPPPAPPDVKAPPKTATKTTSGLVYKVLQKGTGTTHPTGDSKVIVNYTGWTPDGKMFDSSITRGEPARFPLGQVIKGWTEGVQLMVKGEKTRFWLPSELAYGEHPRPGAPAGPLVFDIELVDFQ